MKLSYFNILYNLGESKHSNVFLVSSSKTNKSYTMKKLNLSKHKSDEEFKTIQKNEII